LTLTWQLKQIIATTLLVTCSSRASLQSEDLIGALTGIIVGILLYYIVLVCEDDMIVLTVLLSICSVNVASSPMSACPTAAAATALRRALNVTNVSGGGKEGEGMDFW